MARPDLGDFLFTLEAQEQMFCTFVMGDKTVCGKPGTRFDTWGKNIPCCADHLRDFASKEFVFVDGGQINPPVSWRIAKAPEVICSMLDYAATAYSMQKMMEEEEEEERQQEEIEEEAWKREEVARYCGQWKKVKK